MQAVFRVDASVKVGTGHVMRCLVLAEMLSLSGWGITFLSRLYPGNVCDIIEQRGFRVLRLADPGAIGADAIDVMWETDASNSESALDSLGFKADLLVVDHYRLDIRWERRLRKRTANILVIDDLADRMHDCDVLLDQNVLEDAYARYVKLVPPYCMRLFGPRYALLRPEFKQMKAKCRIRSGVVRRILLFFGGSDPTNETAKVLRALQKLNRRDLIVDVVVGVSNPHGPEIEKQCAAMRATYHCQVNNMAELMADADLAIGAGGTASWERCSVGLPALVITVADNQRSIACSLEDAGAITYLGHTGEVTVDMIEQGIQALLSSPYRLQALASTAASIVDGLGAFRVAHAIETYVSDNHVTLRQANLGDENNLYEWRTDSKVNTWSFDNKPFSIDEHQHWFRNSLSNPARHILIASVRAEAMGVLRYDINGNDATVSIYLRPGMFGKGIGTQILCRGTVWLRGAVPTVDRIRAYILPGNHASRIAFLKAGYVRQENSYVLDLSLWKG